MIAAIGHSEDLDSADAIEEAVDQCAATLDGHTPQACLLYAGIDHDFQDLLDGIDAHYPGLQLIGCTTHGELSSDGFAEDSVVLMLFHSEHVQFRAGVGEHALEDPGGAAQRAVAMAEDGLTRPVRLCITVPEGLGIDTVAVLDTLASELGAAAAVCGGLASDQGRFTGTHQFCNGAVYVEAVPILLIAGPLRVATGVASGWRPIGEDHRLTKAQGHVVSEIDGVSPRDFWTRYFGSADMSGRNAFAVYPDAEGGSQEYYLCAPSHFQEDGSMVTLNPALEGARMRFVDASRDQVLAGAGTSAELAWTDYGGGTPDAALIFSCAGRHLMLGTRVGLEVGQLQQQIGADISAIGFYTNGEICPLPGSQTPFTHAGTFVTVLIGEEE